MMENMMENIKNAAQKTWEFAKKFGQKLAKHASEGIRGMWNALKGAFAWDREKTILENIGKSALHLGAALYNAIAIPGEIIAAPFTAAIEMATEGSAIAGFMGNLINQFTLKPRAGFLAGSLLAQQIGYGTRLLPWLLGPGAHITIPFLILATTAILGTIAAIKALSDAAKNAAKMAADFAKEAASQEEGAAGNLWT